MNPLPRILSAKGFDLNEVLASYEPTHSPLKPNNRCFDVSQTPEEKYKMIESRLLRLQRKLEISRLVDLYNTISSGIPPQVRELCYQSYQYLANN